jgi:hypothetical protein
MAQRRVVHQKDTMGEFLNPDNGYRGSLVRKGIQPKDHMKDNVKELRLAQMRQKMKKDEEDQPEKPLYKLAQFQNVESRLYDIPKENIRRQSFEPKEFLTRGASERRQMEIEKSSKAVRAELEMKLEEQRQYSEQQLTPRKASVPRPHEYAQVPEPSNTNFISRNRVEAVSNIQGRRNSFNNDDNGKHDEFGRVPQYLVDRKQKWEEEKEEMRRRLPDPNCPPGMRLMPEEERLNTLQVLQESKETVLEQLRRMPFVIETPSLRKKQDALESKLREIENALTIFSKQKVFVAKN